MPEPGPSLPPRGRLIPSATENASAASNPALSGWREVLPSALSRPAEGPAHGRSWGSILRRLTRWGPNSEQFLGRATPRGSVRISPTELRFVANGLVENGSVEDGSVEDGRGPTEAAQVSADAAAAMAAAVRRQLTIPGSVPPGEQLLLILADRQAHQLCDSATALGIELRPLPAIPFSVGDLRSHPERVHDREITCRKGVSTSKWTTFHGPDRWSAELSSFRES